MADKNKSRTPNAVLLVMVFVLGAAAFALVLWSAGVQAAVRSELSSVDVVTIILGALGVMIAILTLFLGVLAIYGWATFRSIIEERFDEAMRQRFDPSKDEYKSLLTKVIEDAKSFQVTSAVQSEVPDLPVDDQPITGEIK